MTNIPTAVGVARVALGNLYSLARLSNLACHYLFIAPPVVVNEVVVTFTAVFLPKNANRCLEASNSVGISAWK